jgi:hypothetical protein
LGNAETHVGKQSVNDRARLRVDEKNESDRRATCNYGMCDV